MAPTTLTASCAQTLGLTPFDTAAHTALTADGFYGTHYAKARTWNAVPDVITYYDLANTLTVWNVTAAGQPTEGQTTGLYDTEKLSVYDKYAMFLHGNNGLSRVQGNGSGRILVIKDSYANCFAPYLTANYADIEWWISAIITTVWTSSSRTTITTSSSCSTVSTASRATPTSTGPAWRLILGIIAVFFHKLPRCFSCIFPGFCGFCPKPLHKIQHCSRMMLSEMFALQEGSLQCGAPPADMKE